jgi:transmembrane sensor
MQDNNALEEHFWSLVSLKLSGEASPEELAELDSLLGQHPEWGLRMELFGNLWNSRRQGEMGNSQAQTGNFAEAQRDSFSRHLQRLSHHLATPVLQYEQAPAAKNDAGPDTPGEETGRGNSNPGDISSHRRIRRIRMAVAASLIGACALIYLYTLHRHAGTGDGYNTVSTRPGSRSKIQLPDGTVVWLNADSRLAYNVSGPGPNREVQLTGEAYFDVAKDKDHPFLIHTPTIDIRVLGTTFDVRSYGNERNTEASLFQGSVEVMLHNNPDKKIILQPNEKLIVHNDELMVSGIKVQPATDDSPDEPLMTVGKVHFQQKDSSYMETLWMNNQLAFDNRTLEEVALQIERWYGVQVTVTDPQMLSTRYSGVFEDETLQQVMEALRLTGNFKYTIRKKEVIITP